MKVSQIKDSVRELGGCCCVWRMHGIGGDEPRVWLGSGNCHVPPSGLKASGPLLCSRGLAKPSLSSHVSMRGHGRMCMYAFVQCVHSCIHGCVHVHVYQCVYACRCVTCVSVHVSMGMCKCMFIQCMHACLCAFVHSWTSACVCASVPVCAYV